MRIKQPSKLDSLIGWAAAFLAIAVILMFLGLLSSVADAAPVCNSPVCVKQRAVIQQVADYPPVYYQIGKAVQQEAVATQQLRQSEEYLELLQLRGFKAGVDAVTAVSGDRPSSPHQPASHEGHPAATDEGQTTPPEPPAEAPPVSDFAGRYPTLAANCTRCHTGTEPKGDVWIDGTTPLDGTDAAPKRDAIAAAIVNMRMPKGKPLDAQTQFNAIVELFTESE